MYEGHVLGGSVLCSGSRGTFVARAWSRGGRAAQLKRWDPTRCTSMFRENCFERILFLERHSKEHVLHLHGEALDVCYLHLIFSPN